MRGNSLAKLRVFMILLSDFWEFMKLEHGQFAGLNHIL